MRSEFEVLFQTSTVTACMIAWAWATVTDIFFSSENGNDEWGGVGL